MMVPALYAAFVLVAAALCVACAMAPRPTWFRALCVGGLFLAVSLAGLAYADLLSRPKPTTWEWLKSDQATVLATVYVENEAIYVWLALPEGDQPRSYIIPWDKKLAEELQEAERQAENNGTAVLMVNPFESTLETREPRRAYAPPQIKLPDKPRETPPDTVIRPESEA